MPSILHRPDWAIPEREATPQALFWSRRSLLGAGAGLPVALAAAAAWAQADPAAGLFPAKRNEAYTLDRPVTDETVNGTYNNFFEFGSHKSIHRAAQGLKTRPWTVTIDGLVEAPLTLDIDDLFKRVAFEERLYRHRCVERWAMAVPWTGFPFKALVDLAKPLASAKFIEMKTFHDPDMASGQKAAWYPWPYTEGVTMAEAANDLAFLVTGAYGKPLAKQHGAPLRLALPWKYGFKSVKSITRFTFTDKRPRSFWEALQPAEYGFWANVNPAAPHPRWSQAEEEMIGTGERRPTQIYNGYGAQVAQLYQGLEGETLFR